VAIESLNKELEEEGGNHGGGQNKPTEFARPYSALMQSIFSPPSSPRQTACADAGVAVLEKFQIQSSYDPSFYNSPDHQSVMVHSVSSSETQGGFQAVIILHPNSCIPHHLKLPHSYTTATTASSQSTSSAAASAASASTGDGSVHLMTSACDQPFVAYQHAPKSQVLSIFVGEYLTLLNFWTQEWPRLRSRLVHQADLMRKGQDQVSISSTLAFYCHGYSHYSACLSSRLAIKAKADSHISEDSKCIKIWLELKSPIDNTTGGTSNGNTAGASGKNVQTLTLPIAALDELVQDKTSINTLNNLVSGYKSKARKRQHPV
jgi:hypothetical protein